MNSFRYRYRRFENMFFSHSQMAPIVPTQIQLKFNFFSFGSAEKYTICIFYFKRFELEEGRPKRKTEVNGGKLLLSCVATQFQFTLYVLSQCLRFVRRIMRKFRGFYFDCHLNEVIFCQNIGTLRFTNKSHFFHGP